jgi:polysaccharide export outer membrane protein
MVLVMKLKSSQASKFALDRVLMGLFFCLLMTMSGLKAQENTADSAPSNASSDSSYTLGPADRLKISIFNQDDLSGDYVLDGNGRFSMPLIGTINAAGLTPSELEAVLVSKLKPDYLVNPRIFIQVVNYRPYYLIGEVMGTGAFPYVAGMTYLTAVAIAGGFTYRAKKEFVYVIRGSDPDREEIKMDIDEKVQPGDIIRVAERIF